jgi:hypothetical protein
MVVTPVLRGMFGIEVDGLDHRLKVTPRLPADWDSAEVRRLRVGNSVVDVSYSRQGAWMNVSLRQAEGVPVRIDDAGKDGVLRVPLAPVEISIGHGLPERGARTAQMKVLGEKIERRALKLELEGVAGSQALLRVRRNGVAGAIQAEGGELVGDEVRVRFGPGSGFVSQFVTIHW